MYRFFLIGVFIFSSCKSTKIEPVVKNKIDNTQNPISIEVKGDLLDSDEIIKSELTDSYKQIVSIIKNCDEVVDTILNIQTRSIPKKKFKEFRYTIEGYSNPSIGYQDLLNVIAERMHYIIKDTLIEITRYTLKDFSKSEKFRSNLSDYNYLGEIDYNGGRRGIYEPITWESYIDGCLKNEFDGFVEFSFQAPDGWYNLYLDQGINHNKGFIALQEYLMQNFGIDIIHSGKRQKKVKLIRFKKDPSFFEKVDSNEHIQTYIVPIN